MNTDPCTPSASGAFGSVPLLTYCTFVPRMTHLLTGPTELASPSVPAPTATYSLPKVRVATPAPTATTLSPSHPDPARAPTSVTFEAEPPSSPVALYPAYAPRNVSRAGPS